ncbi:hypothetical protein PAPYR_251 [Paratrimastix pyriformis]|uniref:Pre-rRNA-processing protein RIX1 N-terminal domain-containing protein n=1 Tax=Paratrimastix pyriformis TaxID=342808 RepID=A0ABQ8UVU8_9EUKA|nr:hypothetical protein PAPYR_251 [Paratrimastix pyriformis]
MLSSALALLAATETAHVHVHAVVSMLTFHRSFDDPSALAAWIARLNELNACEFDSARWASFSLISITLQQVPSNTILLYAQTWAKSGLAALKAKNTTSMTKGAAARAVISCIRRLTQPPRVLAEDPSVALPEVTPLASWVRRMFTELRSLLASPAEEGWAVALLHELLSAFGHLLPTPELAALGATLTLGLLRTDRASCQKTEAIGSLLALPCLGRVHSGALAALSGFLAAHLEALLTTGRLPSPPLEPASFMGPLLAPDTAAAVTMVALPSAEAAPDRLLDAVTHMCLLMRVCGAFLARGALTHLEQAEAGRGAGGPRPEGLLFADRALVEGLVRLAVRLGEADFVGMAGIQFSFHTDRPLLQAVLPALVGASVGLSAALVGAFGLSLMSLPGGAALCGGDNLLAVLARCGSRYPAMRAAVYRAARVGLFEPLGGHALQPATRLLPHLLDDVKPRGRLFVDGTQLPEGLAALYGTAAGQGATSKQARKKRRRAAEQERRRQARALETSLEAAEAADSGSDEDEDEEDDQAAVRAAGLRQQQVDLALERTDRARQLHQRKALGPPGAGPAAGGASLAGTAPAQLEVAWGPAERPLQMAAAEALEALLASCSEGLPPDVRATAEEQLCDLVGLGLQGLPASQPLASPAAPSGPGAALLVTPFHHRLAAAHQGPYPGFTGALPGGACAPQAALLGRLVRCLGGALRAPALWQSPVLGRAVDLLRTGAAARLPAVSESCRAVLAAMDGQLHPRGAPLHRSTHQAALLDSALGAPLLVLEAAPAQAAPAQAAVAEWMAPAEQPARSSTPFEAATSVEPQPPAQSQSRPEPEPQPEPQAPMSSPAESEGDEEGPAMLTEPPQPSAAPAPPAEPEAPGPQQQSPSPPAGEAAPPADVAAQQSADQPPILAEPLPMRVGAADASLQPRPSQSADAPGGAAGEEEEEDAFELDLVDAPPDQ